MSNPTLTEQIKRALQLRLVPLGMNLEVDHFRRKLLFVYFGIITCISQ